MNKNNKLKDNIALIKELENTISLATKKEGSSYKLKSKSPTLSYSIFTADKSKSQQNIINACSYITELAVSVTTPAKELYSTVVFKRKDTSKTLLSVFFFDNRISSTSTRRGGKELEYFIFDGLNYLINNNFELDKDLVSSNSLVGNQQDLFKKITEAIPSFKSTSTTVKVIDSVARRSPSFSNGQLSFEDRGNLIKDIEISTNKGKSNLSIKRGKRYSIANLNVDSFMKGTTQKDFYKFFGISGKKMEVFGDEYFNHYDPTSKTFIPRPSFLDSSENYEITCNNFVKDNLTSVIKNGYGKNLILVNWVNKNQYYVTRIGNSGIGVDINSNISYRYPEIINTTSRNSFSITGSVTINTYIHGYEFYFKFRNGKFTLEVYLDIK